MSETNQHRSVGRIDFSVIGIARQIRRQIAAGSIDRRLHVATCGVNIAIQIELQHNAGRADLAGRRHLVDARNAAELPLQWSGYGRSHSLRTRARQRRAHLDHRKFDLRQRRNRQELKSNNAGKQEPDGQQRGADRPLDEWRRDAQLLIPRCRLFLKVTESEP